MSMLCQSIGCWRTPTVVLVWHDSGEEVREKVCRACGEAYVRRPALWARLAPLFEKPAPVLRFEPSRKSPLCGYQIAYGIPGSQFCGRRKAVGLHFCQEHHDHVMDEYGEVRMAPGNAVGTPPLPTRQRRALQGRLTP